MWLHFSKIILLFPLGVTDGCLQRCLKPTNPSLDPVLLVQDPDRDPARVHSPNPARVLVLSHDQENAGLGKCAQL